MDLVQHLVFSGPFCSESTVSLFEQLRITLASPQDSGKLRSAIAFFHPLIICGLGQKEATAV